MAKRRKEIRLEQVFVGKANSGVRIPEIVIYPKINFEDTMASLRTNCNIEYVGEWLNDNAMSVVIVSGEWEFYKDAGFITPLGRLTPGYYADLEATLKTTVGVSSVKCINP